MVAAEGGLILVSGPSRGGKSLWAESLMRDQRRVTYVATSAVRPYDPEWQKRLKRHRERRPTHWSLLEVKTDLAAAITAVAPNEALLIDSLGGFVAWCLDQDDHQWQGNTARLLTALTQRRQPVIVVIEETGWGVVPATAIGGLFRDRLGALAQMLETHSHRSWLVVQGRALDLHTLGVPVCP